VYFKVLCSVTLQQLWSLRSLLLFCRQQQRIVRGKNHF
jgi:hypothetical protein